MALTSFSDLKDAIADWMVKASDTTFTGRAEDFVTLCEADISAELRVPELERRGQAQMQTSREFVPPDFMQARTVSLMHLSGRRTELIFKSPDQMVQFNENNYSVATVPRYYTIMGRELWFLPEPSPRSDGTPQEFELLYYAKIQPLTNSAPTNEVLETYPHVYLYGCLRHAATFILDNKAANDYAQKFRTAIETANREGAKSRWANTPAVSMAQ